MISLASPFFRTRWASACGAALLMLFLFSLVPGAQAEIVILNTLESSPNLTGIAPDQYYAQKFTTGDSEEGFILNSIGLLRDVTFSDKPMALAIYADGGTHPIVGSGTVLAQAPSDRGHLVVQYLPQTPLILAGNTSYWITLFAPTSAITSGFFTTDSANYTSSPGWIYHTTTMAYTSNGGTSWQTYDLSIQVQINATAVPEPSTWALVTIAGVGCLVLRHRRRLAKAA